MDSRVVIVLAALSLWGFAGAGISKAVERSSDKSGRKPGRHRKGPKA